MPTREVEAIQRTIEGGFEEASLETKLKGWKTGCMLEESWWPKNNDFWGYSSENSPCELWKWKDPIKHSLALYHTWSACQDCPLPRQSQSPS
jgi:hypothetical protein